MNLFRVPKKWETYTYALLVTLMLVLGGIEFFDSVANFSDNWYWILIAVAYSTTINDTFIHRLCCHSVFKIDPSRVTYKILVLLSTVDLGYAPVRSMVLAHNAHHLYSDQGNKDPNNFKVFWWGAPAMLPLRYFGPQPMPPKMDRIMEFASKRFAHIVNDPWTIFCETHAILIPVITLCLLYVFVPVFLFKVVLMGRFLISVIMILNGMTHVIKFPFNYKHFNTKDEACNNIVLHYLFLGFFSNFLHNTHHAKPDLINLSQRWYEIDTSTPVVYLLKFLLEERSLVAQR